MREIPLSQGFVALVDDEDYPALVVHRWFAVRSGQAFYARRNLSRAGGTPRASICMHQAILGKPPAGHEIDHIEHRPNEDRIIDNRRSNLRFVTRAQNSANHRKFRGRSIFKGVSLHLASGLWRATLRVGGRHRNVGYFKFEVNAASAYDLAAVAARGDYAQTNFPVLGSRRWIYG